VQQLLLHPGRAHVQIPPTNLQNLCASIALGDKCTSTSARGGTSLRLETGKIKIKNKIIIVIIIILYYIFLKIFYFWLLAIHGSIFNCVFFFFFFGGGEFLHLGYKRN
jgi:hypothetical protein